MIDEQVMCYGRTIFIDREATRYVMGLDLKKILDKNLEKDALDRLEYIRAGRLGDGRLYWPLTRP